MLLLWVLLVSAAAFDINLPYTEREFPFKDIASFSNVSMKCVLDITKWMVGLEQFGKELIECASDSANCSSTAKQKLKYNFYALKQLDAFGRFPAGFLDLTFVSDGSYSECREVGDHYAYKTKYCYMSKMPGKNKEDNCAKGLVKLQAAVCMPNSCSDEDLVNIFNQVELLPFTYCSAKCVNDDVEPDTFFWIYMSLLMFMGLWAILATVTDFLLEASYKMESKKVKNTYLRILLSFSFYTNASAIMDTKPARDGHIKSLDCIRFLSMMWVVAGHCEAKWGENNTLQPIFTVGRPLLADIVTNAFYSVDTFFLLSGILVAYMFFKMSPKLSMIKNPFTWVLYYVHRYLRLTPPYILFIGFLIAVGPFVVGPQSSVDSADNMQDMVDVCKKYWWQNLLYMNNFDVQNICYPITWYLTDDTQMYIVAPIFLIALYFSHIIGLLSILAAIIGSVTANYVLTYKYDLPGSPIVITPGSADYMSKLYLQPWIRCTPYLIGLYVGYLLAVYRNKRIRLHPVSISYLLCIAGWMIATAIALGCVFGPDQYISFKVKWSKFQSATYYAWSRIGWAIAVSWVIVANHRGWGGPIAKFMDFPMWQPFGRLSYCAYMVHYFVLYYYFNLLDGPIHLVSMWQVYLYYAVPITVCAYVFAFFWSCLCEIPFLKLEKMAVDAVMGIGSRKRTPTVVPEKKEKSNSWEGEVEAADATPPAVITEKM